MGFGDLAKLLMGEGLNSFQALGSSLSVAGDTC